MDGWLWGGHAGHLIRYRTTPQSIRERSDGMSSVSTGCGLVPWSFRSRSKVTVCRWRGEKHVVGAVVGERRFCVGGQSLAPLQIGQFQGVANTAVWSALADNYALTICHAGIGALRAQRRTEAAPMLLWLLWWTLLLAERGHSELVGFDHCWWFVYIVALLIRWRQWFTRVGPPSEKGCEASSGSIRCLELRTVAAATTHSRCCSWGGIVALVGTTVKVIRVVCE